MQQLSKWLQKLLAASALGVLLAACGGGGDDDKTATSAAVAVPIGSAGGSVSGGDGLRLDVPAGALPQTVAIQIEQTSAGAPPLPVLPAGMVLRGSMQALTPHGTRFDAPVMLSMPRGAAAADERVFVLKTNEDLGGWQQIEARSVGDRIEVPIQGFSYSISYSMCSRCTPPVPPVIGTPPRGGSVDEGGYVLLSVDAIGDAPFSYQWIRDGGRMQGETGRGLVINPVTLNDDGMSLVVEVRSANGLSVRSAPAVVRVRPVAPLVVSDPADVQARVGRAAEFAAGTRSGLTQTLQWERSNDGGSTWSNAPSNTPRLSLPAVSAADDGALFRLQASNASGSVNTRAARLTVLPQLTAPQLVSLSPDLQVPLGASASFVAAFNGAELEYSWERRDANSSTFVTVPSADSATLTLAAVSMADHGARFRATARNGAGSTTSPEVQLTVFVRIGNLPQRLSAGSLHSLGLAGDGRLWGWGGNYGQQLAPASSGTVLAPVVLGGWNNVAAFAAGGGYNLVLQDDGVLHAWGSNNFGEAVYFDNATAVAVPTPVFGFNVTARAVAAGPLNAMAMGLSLPSRTLVWGIGYYGDGQVAFSRDAVPVPRSVAPELVRAALGEQHSLGITATGAVVAWGRNGEGQLGVDRPGVQLNAVLVPTLSDVVAVAVGSSHSMALNSSGVVQVWGSNAFGQLGVGATTLRSNMPRALALPAPAQAIAAGRTHALALMFDGRLFAWGQADRGQVGHGRAGATEVVREPREITAAWALPLQAIAAGDQHSLALDAAGVVWAWGANADGQLGDGTRTDRAAPVQVQGLNLGAR